MTASTDTSALDYRQERHGPLVGPEKGTIRYSGEQTGRHPEGPGRDLSWKFRAASKCSDRLLRRHGSPRISGLELDRDREPARPASRSRPPSASAKMHLWALASLTALIGLSRGRGAFPADRAADHRHHPGSRPDRTRPGSDHAGAAQRLGGGRSAHARAALAAAPHRLCRGAHQGSRIARHRKCPAVQGRSRQAADSWPTPTI